MTDVFIIGCKGIPAKYGGYETFVENLTSRKIDESIHYHVSCLGSKKRDYIYNNAHCFELKVPNVGPARALYADILGLKYVLKYVKKNNIRNFTVLVLACRIGLVFKKYVKKIHKLGGKVIINPDGHEWKRSKWSKPIKMYWKYSEKKMVKYADLVVCDSINIEKYIIEEYKAFSPKTTFISYGADATKSKIDKDDNWVENWMNRFGIIKQRYYLVVGRFVPENNYETIIREFMKSNSTKDLVIITNSDGNNLYRYLNQKLQFEKDSRIKFVGTVYQPDYLKKIREDAFAYIHGHSVGGTNPSLLEALASTQLNLLYNCDFNKEVGDNSCFYWTCDENNLSSLINRCEILNAQEVDKMNRESTNIIIERYNWNKIVFEYEKIIK